MTDSAQEIEQPSATTTQTASEPAQKAPLQPLVLVSATLALISGVFSLFAFGYMSDLIAWAQSPENAASFTTWGYLVVLVLAPVLAFGAVYVAMFQRDLKRFALVVTAAYVLPSVIATVLEVSYVSLSYGLSSMDWALLYRNFVPQADSTVVDGLATVCLLISIIIAWIAVSVNKNQPTRQNVAASSSFGGATVTNQQPIGFDPQTGAPIYAQTGYIRPESPLPLIALLGGIFFPLLGIIVGHIALGQIKRGEIPSTNQGLAKAGVILGYVFMALGIVALVIYIAIVVALTSPAFYY